MSTRRQQRAAQRAAEQQRAQVARGVTGAALVVLVAALVWFGYQRFAVAPAAPAAGDLPGPRGGPSVAQDVGTMVGKPAPAFILNDSEGKHYAVAPGEGRPLVLVFHMGIT